jgi:hypothetical protein
VSLVLHLFPPSQRDNSLERPVVPGGRRVAVSLDVGGGARGVDGVMWWWGCRIVSGGGGAE